MNDPETTDQYDVVVVGAAQQYKQLPCIVPD